MKKKEIEDLFKDSFEDFEAEVTPTVWDNIKTGLKGAGLGLLGKTIFNKIGTNAAIAVVSTTVTVIGTVLVMHWMGSATPKTTSKNKNTESTSAAITPKIIVNNLTGKEAIEPTLVINNGNPTSAKDNAAGVEQKMQETKVVVKQGHTDKNKIKSVMDKDFAGVPIASIFASTFSGSAPLIVNFSNTGVGKINDWNFNDASKLDKTPNTTHLFINPGTYKVSLSASDKEGRTETDTIKIEVSGVSARTPVEFTPNGDGVNDAFELRCRGGIVKSDAQIFDKNAHLVYEWKGAGKWIGKDQNGEECKEGIYYWFVTGQDINGKNYEQKGSIHLSR